MSSQNKMRTIQIFFIVLIPTCFLIFMSSRKNDVICRVYIYLKCMVQVVILLGLVYLFTMIFLFLKQLARKTSAFEMCVFYLLSDLFIIFIRRY